LAQCGRCRGAVAAAASGVPGPGETVVYKRAGRRPQMILKYGVALLSVVVAGITWRYGAANPGATVDADALRLGASLESKPVAPVQEADAELRDLPAPSPSARPPAPDVPRVTPSAASAAPRVSLVTEPNPGSTDTKPTLGTSPERRAVAAAVPRPKRQPARLRRGSFAASSIPAVASQPPNVAKRAPKDEDFDFGIDEPGAAPAPRRSRSRIRATLE
jgi:hypothetical protein